MTRPGQIDITQATIVPLETRDPRQASQRLALFDEKGNAFLLTPLGKHLNFVSEVSLPWEASNDSVTMTPDGLVFGPYEDSGQEGGSIRYFGLEGQPFSVVRNLAYYIRYTSSDKNVDQDQGAVPYLRVFLADPDDPSREPHSVVFNPSTQGVLDYGPGRFQEFVGTAGTWRFDDDAGSGTPEKPLSEWQDQYGSYPIVKINVSVGFSGGGHDLTGLLRWMQIDGNRYTFGL